MTVLDFKRGFVITGAPCSGKTAVIRELERRGFQAVHETAREIIEAGLAAGLTVAEIRADEDEFERRILRQKMAKHRLLPTDALLFFDRGIPDSIAYFTFFGLDIEEPLRLSRQVRYKGVFLFDPLPFEQDTARAEDEQSARRLDALLVTAYENLGYDPVRVPVLPVPERTDFVLTRCGCPSHGF